MVWLVETDVLVETELRKVPDTQLAVAFAAASICTSFG